jgi:hypothetical protein
MNEEKENPSDKEEEEEVKRTVSNPKNRQALAGLLTRKKNNKENSDTLKDLKENHTDLEHENKLIDVSLKKRN